MPIGDFDDTKGWSSTQNADGTGLAFVGDDVVLSEDVIERLRTQELDLWKDDRECQDDAELDEIRVQIEQEFVDQVLAEFPELSE
jgi:predicted glutamine amidotransferase